VHKSAYGLSIFWQSVGLLKRQSVQRNFSAEGNFRTDSIVNQDRKMTAAAVIAQNIND
jgi:hypothetical protein